MNRFNLTSVSNEAGFTLLEILIAITLLAFITIGVVSITDDAAQTMERTTEINENNLQIETAMSRFDWDFSQIYSPLYFSTIMNMNANQTMASGDTGAFQDGSMPGTMPGTTTGATPPAQQVSPYLQQYYESLINRFERNENFMGVSKEGLPVPRFHNPEKNVLEFFTTSNRRKLENQKQSHFA
jgi:prepilin-type N-terminal cleavage/methylation domain-containing protein